MYEKLREWRIDNGRAGFPKGGIEEAGDPLKLGHYDTVWDIVRSLRL
jgi:hypothetical protein